MSDSVRPHRWQPATLPCPWDSPGKDTGVGCHFLLQCMKVKSESEVAQSYLTLLDPMDRSLPKLLCPWDFPGKSTGVGCHCLLRSSSQILLIHNLYLSILQNRNLLHLQHADSKHSCLYNGCILNDVVMGFPLYVGGW